MIWHRLHTAIIVVWVIWVTLVLGIMVILVAFFSRNGNFPHLIARAWARSILIVACIPVRVEGIDNLKIDGSYILMANHQSNFDIPVLLGCLPVQFRWLAKAELFKIPIFGRGMRGCGYISIDRSNRKSAFRSLAEAAQKIRNGVSVLIFPEGTRSWDGEIQPFKKGGFVLSVDAGVPIIPIIITGTRAVMPKGKLLIRKQTVAMKILAPITTSDYTRKTKDDLMEVVKDTIYNAYKERVDH